MIKQNYSVKKCSQGNAFVWLFFSAEIVKKETEIFQGRTAYSVQSVLDLHCCINISFITLSVMSPLQDVNILTLFQRKKKKGFYDPENGGF